MSGYDFLQDRMADGPTAPDRPLLPEGAGPRRLPLSVEDAEAIAEAHAAALASPDPVSAHVFTVVSIALRAATRLRRSEAERRQMEEALEEIVRLVSSTEEPSWRFWRTAAESSRNVAIAALRSSSSTPEEAPNG
jgi:hypothetical protein